MSITDWRFDFAEISDMTSSNGLLVVELVRHVLERFPDEMPPCYKHFIGNVCKPTSVRGLLQVLTPEPLQYLEQYCKEELNLRIHSSQQQLHCISQLVLSLAHLSPSLFYRLITIINRFIFEKIISSSNQYNSKDSLLMRGRCLIIL